MWNKANSILRRRLPAAHALLKRAVLSRFDEATSVPAVPKRLRGSIRWFHPMYLTSNLDAVEPHVYDWFRQRLRLGSVFFDVGAYHGLHSVSAAGLVGRRGTVVAFEPSPANLIVLKYHVRVNHLSQVIVVPAAVADLRNAKAPFWLVNGGSNMCNSLTIGGDHVPFDAGERRETSVETITLDEYCGTTGAVPDLVKIDVEGAELLVLQGATRTLSTRKPDLVLAVHPFWLPEGQSTKDIVTYLHAMDYSIWDSGGRQVESLEYGEYLCTTGAACQ